MDERMRAACASPDDRRCIYTPCLLCGGWDFVIIAAPSDIAAQQCYLEQFHQRRLDERLSVETRRTSLTDRVSFTHNYETHIVACRACGLLSRNPHPPPEAVTKAYIHSPRLTEVGSFVGGFLEAAREHGWDIVGVDPGEAVVRFCRDRGLPVVHGTLEQRLQPSNTVDAVVIWNTFDQLPDPRPPLRAIEQLLKPDGLLIIRIPHGICYRDAMDATNVHRWLRKPL